MRILHTADWHLGKIFRNISLVDEQRVVLEQFLDIVKKEKPDVIILAGDIYDRAIPPGNAVRLFDEVVSEIVLDLKIPLIAIGGNHDHADRINYCNDFLNRQGLYIFGSLKEIECVTLQDKFGPVHFYPIPYTEPEGLRYRTGNDEIRTHQDVMDWVIEEIKKKHPEGERSVFIGHAFIDGGGGSDSERPLSMVGGASLISADVFDEFDYTAFGHLHERQSFLGEKVHYAGSLLKYSFSEVDHLKSVTLVEMDKEGGVELEFIPLDPLHDVLRVHGHISDEFEFILEKAVQPPGREDYLEINLTNEEVVINAMHIVQKKYPNAMSLKWVNRNTGVVGGNGLDVKNMERLDEIELFSRFYKTMMEKDIDDKKLKIVSNVVEVVKAAAK